MSNTHYAKYSICPSQLSTVAMEMYEAMREKWPLAPILLVYRGYSGASLGCAILTVAGISGDDKISGFFSRKASIMSHQMNESPHDARFLRLYKGIVVIVVDDFVDTGGTIEEAWDAAKSCFYWPVADKALFLWSSGQHDPDLIQEITGFEKLWLYESFEINGGEWHKVGPQWFDGK